MDIREKLAELLEEARLKYHVRMKDFPDKYNTIEWHDYFADHLIANGVMIQEWIPVSEPPDEGMPVLTFHNKYVEEYGNMVSAVRKNGNWYGCLGSTITHWSHLPLPPKGEQVDET